MGPAATCTVNNVNNNFHNVTNNSDTNQLNHPRSHAGDVNPSVVTPPSTSTMHLNPSDTITGSSTFKLSGKGLLIAHVNICSLRNKVPDLCMIMKTNGIHIMAISEIHLDSSFEDVELAVDGYTLFRKDRTRYGGGVAVYVQNHIPVKIRNEFATL